MKLQVEKPDVPHDFLKDLKLLLRPLTSCPCVKDMLPAQG